MFAVLMMTGAAVAMTPDQTSDALLALTFIDDVKRGAVRQARSLLAPRAFLGDYARTTAHTLSDFSAYVQNCQLYKVTVVPQFHGHRPLPVGIEWSCPYPSMNRTAGFWLEGNRISRIAWGASPPPIVSPGR